MNAFSTLLMAVSPAISVSGFTSLPVLATLFDIILTHPYLRHIMTVTSEVNLNQTYGLSMFK